MTIDGKPIQEIVRPSARQFREEIYPAAEPVIMRGIASNWDIVGAAQDGTDALSAYLQRFDSGAELNILTAPAEARGRFFYSGDMRGFNFTRETATLSGLLERLSGKAESDADGTVYLEATPAEHVLPGMHAANRLEHAPPAVEPRIWIGNETTVQTHFDLSQNIACVVSGRRRFTLFPPDQTPNLYMGPIEYTPSGTPVSMVRLDDVDTDRFPRFEQARQHAMVAELEPGDAIFIPYMWWHHAQSFGPFNILVNYWWNEYDVLGSPMNAMLHAMLTIRDLPPPMREAWRAMFANFIFEEDGPAADHIPPEKRGGLGRLSGQMRANLWSALRDATARHADFANKGPRR